MRAKSEEVYEFTANSFESGGEKTRLKVETGRGTFSFEPCKAQFECARYSEGTVVSL